MNRYLSLACWLVAFFYLSSCESYSEPTEKAHQADQPIVLTSFYPKEGGARDKILLDGKNFGTDVSKIKVYFNNARASVVSSSGSRIYAIVPRLPGDNPRISVVVDTDSVAYEETYAYHTQALVSTVTGNGETSINPCRIGFRTLFRRQGYLKCFSSVSREAGNECQFIHLTVSVQVVQLRRNFSASFHYYGRLYFKPGVTSLFGLSFLPGVDGLLGIDGRSLTEGLSELEGLPEVDGLPDVDGLPEVDGLWSVSGRGREVFPGRPDVLGRDVVPGRPEVPGRVGALCGRTEVFGRKRTEPKSERR